MPNEAASGLGEQLLRLAQNVQDGVTSSRTPGRRGSFVVRLARVGCCPSSSGAGSLRFTIPSSIVSLAPSMRQDSAVVGLSYAALDLLAAWLSETRLGRMKPGHVSL